MLLAHLMEDDWRLSEIKEECRHGTRMCGPCKKEAAEMTQRFLKDFQEKKNAVGDSWKEYVVEGIHDDFVCKSGDGASTLLLLRVEKGMDKYSHVVAVDAIPGELALFAVIALRERRE
jgi:hypothetical protein